jgi:hypothetical protein
MPQPIHDDALVDLANALAGLRRELAAVAISTTVDVDPTQRFGPWQAVVDAVRAGATGLGPVPAGTLLERSVPAAERLQAALGSAREVAVGAGRDDAVEACTVAAIEDAATLAAVFGQDDPGLVFAMESACATVLAAAYATWVTRDLVDEAAAASGIALLDVTLRPVSALARLRSSSRSASAVLDAAEAQPRVVWEALAEAAVLRPEAEAMAAVQVRALAAVAGCGAAEAGVVAALAPAAVEPEVAYAAATVIGDAAVAVAGSEAGAVDEALCARAAAAWTRSQVAGGEPAG